MSQRAFHLDVDRCTGCHACAVACGIENAPQRPEALDWRRVVVFNPARHPGLPSFALSLACQHCVRPACLAGCPAGAFTKDAGTGAVLLRAERCMGCRYCTWACPYDAPRYVAATGTVAKCTFCQHRLREGREPACVVACPTGALRVGEHAAGAAVPALPGLPPGGLEPALRITPPRRPPPEIDGGEAPAPARRALAREPGGRLGAGREWPLVALTAVVIAQVAAFAALQLGLAPPRWLAPAFVPLGAGALLVSLAHLGRPARAWRAAGNLGASWLSREVALIAAFLAAAGAWLAFVPVPPTASARLSGGAVALLGLAATFAIDRVYAAIAPASGRPGPGRPGPLGPALVGALWLAGLFARLAPLALAAAAWKAWFDLRLLRQALPPRARLLLPLRVALTLALPLALLAPHGPGADAALAALAILGEWLERALYYEALQVTTPRLEMAMALERALEEGAARPAAGGA